MQRYDAIIVLDSPNQPIYDNLAYLEELLRTHNIESDTIIIPASLTCSFISNSPLSSLEQFKRTDLKTYLQWSPLRDKIQFIDSLSSATLGAYLKTLFTPVQPTAQTATLYNLYYTIRSTKRILVVTDAAHAEKHQQTAVDVFNHFKGKYPQVDITYPPITMTDDLTQVAEPLTQVQTRPPETTPAISAANSTAAHEQPDSDWKANIVLSITAIGMFAAANPNATRTAINIARTTVAAIFKG